MVLDEFDFGFDSNDEIEGISFNFRCKFNIIEFFDGYYFNIVHLYKKSFNEKEKMDVIIKKNPMSISDVSGLELNEYKTDKQYIGNFIVYYYEDNTYDIFLNKIEK